MTDKTEVDMILERYNGAATSDSVVLVNQSGAVIKALNEEDIKLFTQEVLDLVLSDVRKYKDFGQSTKVLQQLLEIKKAYWPATQVNKNMNINLFDDALEKWYKAAKELKRLKEEEKEKAPEEGLLYKA